jgi:hypothetical protein
MSGDQLAIVLFWLTLAFGAGVEALKAETLTRRIGFAVAAVLFLALAIFWEQVRLRWPGFTESIDSIAKNPETWFILAVLGYVAISFWSSKRQSERQAIDTRLKDWRAEITPEIAKVVNNRPAETDLAELKKLRTEIEQLRTQIAADITRLNEVGVVQHGASEFFRTQLSELRAAVKNLDERFATHQQVVASGTSLLIRGLRARDALRDILTPSDQIAMSLGTKLMYPDDYPSAQAWLADYLPWRTALRTIDDLMIEWTKRQHPTVYASLFDLKGYHYEQAPMPPDNIRSDETIIAFKTVCQVQSSYANQRDGICALFQEKAVYPG